MYNRKNYGGKLAVGAVIVAATVLAFPKISEFLSASSSEQCSIGEADPDRSGYCTVDSKAYDELVIVTGNTQNTPLPSLESIKDDEIKQAIAEVFYQTERGSTPRVTIISAASNNFEVDLSTKNKPAKNITASENNLKRFRQDVETAVATPAEAAGADYLGAIIAASQSFSSSAKRPLIVVLGSGYSDSGVLNFATGEIFERFQANSDNITNLLDQSPRTKKASLEGITVYWYGIGKVVDPQPSMDDYINDTQEIYQLALEHLNVKTVKFGGINITANTTSADSPYSVTPTYVKQLEVGDTFNVNETVGEFYPDSNALKNPSEVSEKLKAFAKQFNATTNVKLKVTGYVAICTDSSEQLSKERADTIKDLLVGLGVHADRIITVGRKGAPDPDDAEGYTCNSSLPSTERRTVKIEVVKE